MGLKMCQSNVWLWIDQVKQVYPSPEPYIWYLLGGQNGADVEVEGEG